MRAASTANCMISIVVSGGRLQTSTKEGVIILAVNLMTLLFAFTGAMTAMNSSQTQSSYTILRKMIIGEP